jgi:hypothetical protein
VIYSKTKEQIISPDRDVRARKKYDGRDHANSTHLAYPLGHMCGRLMHRFLTRISRTRYRYSERRKAWDML